MKNTIEQTFTLGPDDIKTAVALYLTQTQNVRVTATDVNIDIDPGSPYYNPSDSGRPASVKVSATIKMNKSPTEIPYAKDADLRYK